MHAHNQFSKCMLLILVNLCICCLYLTSLCHDCISDAWIVFFTDFNALQCGAGRRQWSGPSDDQNSSCPGETDQPSFHRALIWRSEVTGTQCDRTGPVWLEIQRARRTLERPAAGREEGVNCSSLPMTPSAAYLSGYQLKDLAETCFWPVIHYPCDLTKKREAV